MKLNCLNTVICLTLFTACTGESDLSLHGQEVNGQFQYSPPIRPALPLAESAKPQIVPQDGYGASSDVNRQPPLLPLRGESGQESGMRQTFDDPEMSSNSPVARYDDSLRPAAWHQPADAAPMQPAQNQRSAEVARFLLSELQQSSRNFLHQYQPMGLEDMLANCDDHRRPEMIRQYWVAWQACADFLFAFDETRWVGQLGQPRDENDRLVLEAARATVADAMLEKEIAMTRELELLNGFLTGPVSETLPWPTDMPMVGEYKSHYDAWAAAGRGNEKLRVINSLMPKQFELISSRAETVQRCSTAIQRATQAWNQAGSGSATMLQALYLSRESHGAFSRSVADYNQKIAEYALTLKPNENSDTAVVAMLLPGRAMPRNQGIPGNEGIRQASLAGDGNYYPTPSGNTGVQGMPSRPPFISSSQPADSQFGNGSGSLQPANSPPASPFRR